MSPEGESGMYQTYGSDLARSRMQDRMREADRYRLTKDANAARDAERRSAFRKIAAAALCLIAWPIKH
jgi:hypothetical protein